jgi:flagellar hook-length control protein FliK
MKSGLVSASQLLAPFLEKEQGKIRQGIVRSDFAGELKKLISPNEEDSTLSAAPSDNSLKSGAKTIADPLQPRTTTSSTNAKATTVSTAGKKKNASTDPKTQIQNQKTKARNGENLLVANPVMTETILSNLHCPAETIKACKDSQNKDGMISVKDLKSLIDGQIGTAGPTSSGQISSEQVRMLLGSITMQGAGSATGTKQSGANNIPASIKIKSNGSYTLSEFSGVLDQVLNQGIQTSGPTTIRSTQAKSTSTSSTVQITGQIKQSLKAGETENLTDSAIPSFVSESTDGQPRGKAKTTQDSSSEPENIPPQQSMDGVAQKNLRVVETAAAANGQTSKADLQPKPAASNPDLSRLLNRQDNAIAENSSGSSASTVASTASAGKDASPDGLSIEDLKTVVGSFAAKIVSSGPETTIPSETVTENLIELQQGSSIPPQDFSVLAKETEKQTSGKSASETSSATTVSRSGRAETLTAPVPPSSLSQQSEDKSAFQQKDTSNGSLKTDADNPAPASSGKVHEFVLETAVNEQSRTADTANEQFVTTTGHQNLANKQIKELQAQDSQSRKSGTADLHLSIKNTSDTGPVSERSASAIESSDTKFVSAQLEGTDLNEAEAQIRTASTRGSAPGVQPLADKGLPPAERSAGKIAPQAENTTATSRRLSQAMAGKTSGPAEGLPASIASSASQEAANSRPVSESQAVDAIGGQFPGKLSQSDKTSSEIDVSLAGKASTAATQQSAEQIMESEKQGQAETLSASTLPSFVSEDLKDPVASQTESTSEIAQQHKEQISLAEAAGESTRKIENTSATAVGKQPATPAARSEQPQVNNARTDSSAVPERETLDNGQPSQASSTTVSQNNSSELNLSDDDFDSSVGFFNIKSDLPEVVEPGSIAGVTESQNTLLQGAAIPVQGMAAVVKETEKQFSEKLASPDNVVVQNVASRLQGDQINLSQMEKSPGESLSHYDPNRAAELIQNYREQLGSSSGQQLTLEMEPTEFGKLSIKVAAKKDEVSAQIVTDNESARQTLLKHSPELRQELQNQGLELGTFNVDVGSDKSGNDGNLPEWVKQGAKEALAAKVPDTEKPQVRPTYTRLRNGHSTLSIFA